MNDKDLWNKRVVPALDKMYSSSKKIYSINHDFTWNDISKYAHPIENEITKRTERMVPIYAFYLSREQYEEIVKQATRYLQSWWVWPWRSEIIYDNEEIERMQRRIDEIKKDIGDASTTPTEPEKISDLEFELHMLQEKVNNNEEHKRREKLWNEYFVKRQELDAKLNSNELNRKEYNKQRDNLCKSYDMHKRCRDAEKISFTIMDFSPCSSDKAYNIIYNLYCKLVWRLKTDRCQDTHLVKTYCEDICNDDESKRYEQDLMASYMFLSNYINGVEIDK